MTKGIVSPNDRLSHVAAKHGTIFFWNRQKNPDQ